MGPVLPVNNLDVAAVSHTPDTLMKASNVTKKFVSPNREGFRKKYLTAVSNVSLEIQKGETLGLVGESGSGKTTLGRLFVGLIRPDAGTISINGQDIGQMNKRELRKGFRRQVSMVFQNPGTSLSPHLRIGDILREPLIVHGLKDSDKNDALVYDMIEKVGLPRNVVGRYADSLSGGQRQRIGIARALMLDPSLIVADEPTSSLDVSVQAQIINLLQSLKSELGLSFLFITHDLILVRHVSNRIAVMFLGEIVEIGSTAAISESPQHPYTAILLSMGSAAVNRIQAGADHPSPTERPSGCVFHTICPIARPVCSVEKPVLEDNGITNVACHFPGELIAERSDGEDAIAEPVPPPILKASV